MKKFITLVVLSLLSSTSYSQNMIGYVDEYHTEKEIVTASKKVNCPNGFMISHDKIIPMVIILDNSMTYNVSEGIFNGEKKLLNQNEIAIKLQNMVTATFNIISSTIVVNNYKPFLIVQFENKKSKGKETIIVPLMEENNYLKMQGTPVKQSTIAGKTSVIVYDVIETKLNDYVGHLALLK